jgi:hypothetical protein
MPDTYTFVIRDANGYLQLRNTTVSNFITDPTARNTGQWARQDRFSNLN